VLLIIRAKAEELEFGNAFIVSPPSVNPSCCLIVIGTEFILYGTSTVVVVVAVLLQSSVEVILIV
jgi:hypothetical protein